LRQFPDGIYELPILENLFIGNNQIEEIDPYRIINMKHLATLNIQNNNLRQVPAELGKATHLKALLLEGNAFRVRKIKLHFFCLTMFIY
jgi:Leucine-rich repeat (LRR) protein